MSVFASVSASAAQVVLVSSDGAEFVVDRDVAKALSGFVQGALMEESEDNQIFVPLVDAASLAKVVDFFVHYSEERMTEFAKPLANNDLTQLVQPFYVEFITGQSEKGLFDLTLAANFMDIQTLMDLCSARIASFIKGQTPEQIRANLNIPVDFTAEEEAAVKAENKWVENL